MASALGGQSSVKQMIRRNKSLFRYRGQRPVKSVKWEGQIHVLLRRFPLIANFFGMRAWNTVCALWTVVFSHAEECDARCLCLVWLIPSCVYLPSLSGRLPCSISQKRGKSQNLGTFCPYFLSRRNTSRINPPWWATVGLQNAWVLFEKANSKHHCERPAKQRYKRRSKPLFFYVSWASHELPARFRGAGLRRLKCNRKTSNSSILSHYRGTSRYRNLEGSSRTKPMSAFVQGFVDGRKFICRFPPCLSHPQKGFWVYGDNTRNMSSYCKTREITSTCPDQSHPLVKANQLSTSTARLFPNLVNTEAGTFAHDTIIPV